MFRRFSKVHEFERPNDRRAIDLMNVAARAVIDAMPGAVLAIGMSDEFSFVYPPNFKLFGRRER